jgi:hypothetical protein
MQLVGWNKELLQGLMFIGSSQDPLVRTGALRLLRC